MRLLPTILPWLLILTVCHGYRILGVFPFSARSHFIMFESLMKSLAKKGHQVDVVSTFPLKKPHPNYTDLVVLPPLREFVNNFSYDDMNDVMGVAVVRAAAILAGNHICKHLANPELQKLLREPPNDPPYDAVVIEALGSNCFGVFAHALNVPLIGISSSALYPWSNRIIANPENLAFMPNNLLSLSNNMDFTERLYNFLHTLYNKLYFNYLTSVQDDIVREHLGPGYPSVHEMEKNFSMILVNSHISMNGIRPMTPALVEVGGLHVTEEGLELAKPLEKWMNESKDGFVYFTFGSMVTIETFPAKYVDIFYKSLAKIAPVRVLMKVPRPEKLPPGLPKNIRTEVWMPQVKILKHPNIKAFISHGGLMGTHEAIHYGVPIVGIPLFADQFINIGMCARKNFAVQLDLSTLTVEKMDHALKEILTNPVYRNTAKEVSAKFLDRPLSAADTATYWTEYIIRHGADALRSPAMDLSWWQIELLDIYLFLLCCIAIIAYVILFVIKWQLKMLNSRENTKVSRTKKVS